jgi:hypothetical protein
MIDAVSEAPRAAPIQFRKGVELRCVTTMIRCRRGCTSIVLSKQVQRVVKHHRGTSDRLQAVSLRNSLVEMAVGAAMLLLLAGCLTHSI